jgi:hypothetical protein
MTGRCIGFTSMTAAGVTGLLVRRQIRVPRERAYYRVYAPADTTLEQMVAVTGKRWAVEECFELPRVSAAWMNTRYGPNPFRLTVMGLVSSLV